MIKITHWILNIIFIIGWGFFYSLQLYYLIPTLKHHCVFWGESLKPADVNYVVFLVCIFLSILIGAIVFYVERKYFHLSISKKTQIILLNTLLMFLWGFTFYIGIKEISIYLGNSKLECLFPLGDKLKTGCGF
ncbi:MAG: hypothetical protein SPL08_02910 [Pseudomonadota bacterium]|nr:hypothetical protein [Pseudomonadota bacterium]